MSGTNYSLLWLLYLLSTATFTEANARVFDVYRTSDWKTNGIIKYQGASANTFGSSINLGTGIFTAPEKGVYRFTFMGRLYTPHGRVGQGWIALKKGGTTIAASLRNLV